MKNASDNAFVESVRQWRLDIPKPIAWISGKVIHQFEDMSDGYEPLYKNTGCYKNELGDSK